MIADDKVRNAFVTGILVGYLAVMFGVIVGGCKTAGPADAGADSPSVGSRIVRCGTDAVQNNWARVYPEVQSCLSEIMESPVRCLDALPTALAVGIEVVACVVRSSGHEARSQMERSPGDVVSVRQAERAAAWLEARGIRFEP